MCNIAGYVGERDAAPILIDMLRREEGIDAGFYTGIATLHEGKIYYRKLCGDLDKLLRETDALSLPGKIGIIHSRTKSGGPDEWSHPFISAGKNGSEARIAYVANGNSGIFAKRDPEYSLIADDLIKEGYKMDSEISLDDGIYNRLSNGKMVHMSDVMCALIAREADLGNEICDAMANAFCGMPGDIVGLLLSLSAPDRIVWSKISRPMTLSFAEHGAYLATTSIAHPDDAVTEKINLPVLSAGYVTKNSFTAKKFAAPPAPVITPALKDLCDAYRDAVCALAEEKTFNEVLHIVTKRFASERDDVITTATQANYDIFEALYKEGRLEIIKGTDEGVLSGTTAPLFKFRLK